MKKQRYILRMETNDTEGNKYDYFIKNVNGLDFTTPFKEKATVFELGENDSVEVSCKEWEFIKVKP